jgi:transcriptional repressor NrdR
MRCPRCSREDDKVVDSRSAKDGAGVRRRRECLGCGLRFSTYEGIVQVELKVKKRSGDIKDFDRDSLRLGIEKACWKRPNIDDEVLEHLVNKVISEIESKFDRVVPSIEIGNIIMRELKKIDEVAYVRFASVYKEFKDIEGFIDEIKSLGGNSRI